MRARDLLGASRKELARLLDGGHAIDPAALDDTEYRGVSLGLPSIVERLTWKKFRKVFHRDPATGRLRGWNVRLEQNGLDAPDVPLKKRGEDFTFGHYEVRQPSDAPAPRPLPGLLIDYGRGRNARLDPVGRLRDPVVALEAGSVELLLGWSYLDLGVGVVGTPSFFSLERAEPLRSAVKPPRG